MNAQVIGDRAESYLVLVRLVDAQSAYEQLQRLDRRKAAEFMIEMLAWQKTLPDSALVLSEETVSQFDRWITEKREPSRI